MGNASSETPAANPRRRQLMILGGVVVAGVALWGGYELLFGGRTVETDNAYVGAEVAQVTPLVAGPVARILVRETQTVKQGDTLLILDDSDARIAVAEARAALGQAERRVAGFQANDDALGGQVGARQADVARARADLQLARLDLARRNRLSGSGAVSGEELTNARNSAATAEAALAQAEANLKSAQGQRQANAVMIKGATIDNPDIVGARARLEAAELALSRTVIRAPTTGVISRKQVQVGQQVAVGAPLMSVAPLQAAYVDANFKEVQLTKVRPGQSVTLVSDLYGDDVKFHGRVFGFAGGTGSAFSLIPAQNASGNWIKVVQRLPVRIDLDPRELVRHPLRVGLSMKAKIDISDAR
ncbi:efflux RND transporter periplasmic adaptor subunit [Phenylobacterium immobile]|uniref:HlyD family secretion protein n=1 Tax=Phenylobacterium immobile TaxID=21 RepID=UPI000A5CF33A|nr:efflux RND transporter periplasmic adaptor subunit [Phenylobacterium immobile]